MYAKTLDQVSPSAMFASMLDGYESWLLAGGRQTGTVVKHIAALNALVRELGFPWTWTPQCWEQHQGQRAAAGKGLRRHQQIVSTLYTYLVTHDWAERCVRLFGRAPQQVVTETNRIMHRETEESGVDVRPATRREMQRFFRFLDRLIDEAASHGTGAQLAYRNVMAIKCAYAFGGRRSEVCGMRREDFGRNPYLPQYGDFGIVRVIGKAKPYGAPRPRIVHTTPLMSWIVAELQTYRDAVRPLFRAAQSDHLFVQISGEPLSPDHLTHLFATYRDQAKLSSEITLHSMRRSYATHHIERGYAGAFVSDELGHEWESSTGSYVKLSDDFRRQQLLAAQRAAR